MNHQLWTRVGARVLAVMFVVAGAAACGDDDTRVSANTATTAAGADANGASDTRSGASGSLDARKEHSGLPDSASSSAVVIGTAPGQPVGNTPQTTAPAGARTELGQSERVGDQPNEGDNHSYSTVAPYTPQKAGGVDPIALEGKQ